MSAQPALAPPGRVPGAEQEGTTTAAEKQPRPAHNRWKAPGKGAPAEALGAERGLGNMQGYDLQRLLASWLRKN